MPLQKSSSLPILQMMQKNFYLRARSLLSSSIFNAPNPNCAASSFLSFDFHRFYASKSESSSENPNCVYSEDETLNKNPNDVSSAELKEQIDKFYKGDVEEIPNIFESILKRKLTGKHEDSDDELMNEFRQHQPNEGSKEDFDSDSDLDE